LSCQTFPHQALPSQALPDLVVPSLTLLHTLSRSVLLSLTLRNATLADFVSPDNARFDFAPPHALHVLPSLSKPSSVLAGFT